MKKIPKFVIPVLISALLFLLAGLFTGTNPYFGGTLNSGDILDQYLSFFGYLRHILLGNLSDFSYSFSNGLGGSMAGNWGYYLLSPLNFIVLLSPATKVNLAIYTIILLKVMVASGSFYYLAKKKMGATDTWSISFGVAYSLSAYVISYFGNLMWLDAIAFLPIIVYGLLSIIDGKFSITYVIFLAITIVANYYTAFMTCLFLVGFFFYQAFITFTNWKVFIKKFVIFAISSLTAALISSFASIPTFYNLLENKLNYSLSTSPIHPKSLLLALPGNLLFAGNKLAVPLMYIGTISTLLVITYFFNSKFSLKERIASLVFLFFIFSGLFSTKLYLLWHGGQPPQYYPFRFAFLIAFSLAYFATLSVSKGLPFNKKNILTWNSVFLFFIIIYYFFSRKLLGIDKQVSIITISVFIISVILINLYIRKQIKPYVLALVIILDIFANTCLAWSKISKNVTSYNPYTEDTIAFLNKIPKQAKKQRLDKSFLINNDRGESYMMNYHGINSFSSNNDSKLTTFGGLLGLPSIGYYTFYSTGTQLTDALFGLNTYVVSNRLSDMRGFYNYGLRDDLIGNKIWYQNKTNVAYRINTFPLAFAGYQANNIKLKENNPLSNQVTVLNSLTNTNTQYFSKAISAHETSNNMTLSHNANLLTMNQISTKSPSTVTFTYHAQPNSRGYILLDRSLMMWADYTDINSAASKLTINGKSFRSLPVNLQPIGVHIPKNGKVVLKIYLRKNIKNKIIIDPKLYLLNQNNLNKTIKLVKSRAMSLTTWKGNYISGHIHLKRGQALITTFPYTSGWQATANGKPVKITKALNRFISLKLPAGNYKIIFKHTMPGLKLGTIISIIGIVLFGAEIHHFKYKNHRIKKGK